MEDNRAVALYMRLSVEDGDVNDSTKLESNSITNQRSMFRQYIEAHQDFVDDEILEFVDDGFSGTNFSRPQFSAMISEVIYKRIKCIIVKDLSRFGRNFVEAGYYLEKLLPLCDVRFIAINDGFDSNDYKGKTGGIAVAIKNYVNNMYSKDNSQKVTTAMRLRARDGNYMASFTPYGYLKNPEDKYHLIIDEDAATIVREIYTMAADGMGKTAIARALNERGVPTPIEHMNSIGINKRPLKEMEKKLWTVTTIGDLIKNEVYIGSTIWNKSKVITVGARRQKKNPRSEWIIVENTHEAIVSKELFEQANRNVFRGKKMDQSGRKKKPTIYFCGTCGRRVYLNGSLRGYRCAGASLTAMPECQLARRNRKELEDSTMMLAKSRAKEMMSELDKCKTAWRRATKHLKGTDTIAKRENKLAEKKMKLYAEYKRGKIDKDTYASEMKAVSEKLTEIRNQLSEIEAKAADGKYKLIASLQIEKALKEVLDLDTFDANTLKNVLDRVIVKPDGTEEYVWKEMGVI